MDASNSHHSLNSPNFGTSSMVNGGEETASDVDNSPPPSGADSPTAEINFESKFQSMTEKGIRRLCLELLDLKKASTEELQRNVYSNHSAFVRISQEVIDLERELMELKMHISAQGSLVHDLMDGIYLEALSSETWTDTALGTVYLDQDPSPSELENRTYYLSDVLGVLLSEHKEEEALAILDAEEKAFPDIQKTEALSSRALALYQSALSEWKARLAEQFVQVAKQPIFLGTEFRNALSALYRLGDGPRAHTLLLSSYHSRLQNDIQSLLPSSAFYSGAYTKALARSVFSTISQAAKDSVAIFGEKSAYASELVLWARKETEKFVQLVKKHILFFSETTGGLRAAAESVQVAVGHCCLLEAQGIALCPYLLKLIRPCLQGVLEVNLKRVQITVGVFVANDDWALTSSLVTNCFLDQWSYLPTAGGGLATQFTLTSSAHKFISMVQDIVEDVSPIASFYIEESILDGIACLFDNYIGILIRAVPCASEDENSMGCRINSKLGSAETEAQQLALLANATALADELLPRAVSKISRQQIGNLEDPHERASERSTCRTSLLVEHKDWRRHLQRTVDRLRDHICQQYVLGFIYSREGDIQLSANTYLDGKSEDLFWGQKPMPSLPFQALFAKLSQLAQLSADVLVGRDRVATQLLMRLTETLVIWLSNDQEFWDMMEDSSASHSPFGLQQFVLDMHFVIETAVSGHYSSRHMQQIVSDILQHVVTAFSATGMDPDSALPEDEWFLDTAREAIKKLLSGLSRRGFEVEDIEPEEKRDRMDDEEPDRKLDGLAGEEHYSQPDVKSREDHDNKYDRESNLELNGKLERDHDRVLYQESDRIRDSPTSLMSADSFASVEFEGDGSPQYFTDSGS